MKNKVKTIVVSLAIPLATGAVSGFLTRNEMQTFDQLNKPPLSPPGWLFPVVWTALYAMMGYASYLIYSAPKSKSRDDSLILYGVQLAVNFVWPLLFFMGKWYFFAFAWLALLWCLVYTTIRNFRGVSAKAANLMIPYLVWLTFAGYLNLFIAVLN